MTVFFLNMESKWCWKMKIMLMQTLKEFRRPSMLLWKVYYKAVRKELDKLLSD